MAHSRLFSSASDVLLPRGGGINPPPEVIATWPAPNYVNPEERGWGAPIVLSIFLLLTLVIYIARIRARFVVNSPGIDDVLMSVAMLPVIGVTISTILGKGWSVGCIFYVLTVVRYPSLRVSVAHVGPDAHDENLLYRCK